MFIMSNFLETEEKIVQSERDITFSIVLIRGKTQVQNNVKLDEADTGIINRSVHFTDVCDDCNRYPFRCKTKKMA